MVGLSALSHPDEILLRPPLVLYLTAEPFEYPRPQWPKTFRLIGPSAWDPPAVSPQWLAGEPRGIVLVTTSSEYQRDGRLVSTALAALRDRTDVFVIATVPWTTARFRATRASSASWRIPSFCHVLWRSSAMLAWA
jgi:UDP:flavonoid glycosyltransferase YjiC (YdhE family)